MEKQVVAEVHQNKIWRNILQEQFFSPSGFTIIEILIAIFLVIVVLSLSLSDTFQGSDDLSNESDKLERAVRFMTDEASLRNTVVRLHLFLNKTPQEYAVEYGPSENFLLPQGNEFETSTMTKEEEEKEAKKNKEINMKFNKVKEFQEENSVLSENVKIIGIGTPYSKNLKTGAELSIHAFPTGEKDDALIILASDLGLISLEIHAFTPNIDKNTHKFEFATNENLDDLKLKMAKEIFDKWKRKN